MTSEAPPSTTRRAVAPVAGRRVIFAGFLEALSDGAVWRPRYGVAVVDEADDAVGDGAAVGLELFEHAECSAAIEFLRGAARPFVLAELGRWGCGGFALDVAGFAPRLFRAPAEQDAGKWRNALGGPPVHLAIASSDVVHRGDVIVDGKRRFVELRSNGDLHQYRYGPTIDAGARWRDHLLDTLSLQSGAKLLVREDGRSFQLNVGDRGAAKRWICTAPLDEGTGGHVEMNAWIAVLRPLADVRHEDAEASPVLEAAPFEEAASGTVHEDPYTLASKLGKVAFVGGVAVAVVAGAGAGTTLALLSGLASAGAGAVATRARRDAKTSADAQLEADAAALRAAAVASLADAGDAAAGRHADVVATVRVRISRVRLVLANDALPPTLRLAGAAANGRARGDASQKMSITLKCGDDEVSLEDFTCLQTEAAVDDAGTHLFFDQAGPAAPQVDHTFHATSTRYAVRIEVKRAGLLLATRVISIFELAQRDAERDVRSAHAALRQLKALVLGPDARPPQDRHAAAGGREGTADEGCFSHDAFHARLRETGERAADGAAWYTMHGTVSDDDDDEAPPSADAAPKESPAGLPSTAFVDGADGGQSSKRILALCEARLDLKWETFLGDGHRADLDRPPRDEVLRPEATLELLRRAFAFVSWVMLASRTLDELLRWDDPKTSFAVLAIGVGCALLWAREHFFALPLVALLAVMLWHGHQRFSGVWLARRVLYREKGDDNLSDLASNRPPRDAATLRLAVRRIDLGVDGGEAPPKIVVKYVPSTAVAALHARIVDAAAIECCASLLRGDAFPPKEAAEALEAARDACKAAAARARAFSGGGGAPLVGDWAIAPIRVGSGVALRRRRRRKGDEEATQGAADEVAGQGLAASSEAASSVWDYAVASVSRTLAPVSQPAPPPAIDASAVHRGLGFLRKAGGALGADVGLAHVGVASRAQCEAASLLGHHVALLQSRIRGAPGIR
ncbi:hypothetical protein M885DRAFT_344406 [Pelagophyceae sp. CCMP2097]|nr:hypothetical protein M885DRAFT_344406 [Pelagophyceae sp. CCMP2097]